MADLTDSETTSILEEARERFELSESNDSDNRKNYKADLAFVYSPGAQWPEEVRATRTGWKELCLEFNQLKQFVAQVVNDQLQNRPGIRVHAASGQASEDTADILQGMVRAIEYESKADDAYKNAFKLAVAAGLGWCRIVSEYETNDGFNQKLVIKPIQDSTTVRADTDYQQPDGSDRNWLFVETSMPKTEFMRKWPGKTPSSFEDLPSGWARGKDDIVVADYYRRVCVKRTMVAMSDGAIGWKDTMPTPPEGVTEVRSREVETYKVEWYTIAGGNQILEQYEWPGTIIPVVQCAGEDMILEGRRVYQGLTRHARDAQSMLNFGMTQQATQLALAPRAPWVMAEGQDEGYQQMWRDANNKNWSALIYKPTTVDGIIVPPPQRTQPAMVSEGWDRWTQTMIAMIKSTIGMYEQSLGQKGNETSGKAITAREKQGDTATFNYVNNWHMMIDLLGRICVEVIPHFYDTERIVATIGPDDTKKLVTINQATPDPDNPLEAIKNNDITKGKYAVTVEAGPSFATKRQESAETLTQLVSAYPEMMAIAGDIVVRAQDIPDADVLADRLKIMLPPQVLEAEKAKEEGRAPLPPQVMAQMQEKDQQLQQAAATMDEMHKKIQELESGAQSKMMAVQADAEVKAKDAEIRGQQIMQEMELKNQQAAQAHELEIAKAQQAGELALEKAKIDAAAKIEVAKIGAEADLLIAQIAVPPELDADSLDENGEKAEKAEKPDPMKMHGEMMETMRSMMEQMGRPKTILRGPDGKVTGVQ